jgi:hypothetical protein
VDSKQRFGCERRKMAALLGRHNNPADIDLVSAATAHRRLHRHPTFLGDGAPSLKMKALKQPAINSQPNHCYMMFQCGLTKL